MMALEQLTEPHERAFAEAPERPEHVDTIRDQVALLAAAAAAIARALSSDSDAFLRQNRQQGGE